MNKIIKRLKDRVSSLEKAHEDMDICSWPYQEGILLTGNEAKGIIAFFERHSYSPQNKEIVGSGKFVLTTRKDRDFMFSLKAGNGQEILGSEAYTTKAACMNGIESVKRNCEDDKRYERLISKNNKYYFLLKAGNGQIIGCSNMYESEASRENGVASVMRNAPYGIVDDQTEA